MNLADIALVDFSFYDPFRPTEEQALAVSCFAHSLILLRSYKKELSGLITSCGKSVSALEEKLKENSDSASEILTELTETRKKISNWEDLRQIIQNDLLIPLNWGLLNAPLRPSTIRSSQLFVSSVCKSWKNFQLLGTGELIAVIKSINTIFVKLYIHPMMQYSFNDFVVKPDFSQHEIREIYEQKTFRKESDYFRVKPEYFKNFQPSLFDDLPKIKGKKYKSKMHETNQ